MRKRGVGWALLLSAALHLLMLVYALLHPPSTEPLRVWSTIAAPMQLASRRLVPVPRMAQEQSMVRTPSSTPALVEPPAEAALFAPLAEAKLPSAPQGEVEDAQRQFVAEGSRSLEDILRSGAEHGVSLQEAYDRLWIPTADTTSLAARNRSRAEQIVLTAIESMGGLDALLGVTDMRYEGRFHQTHGPVSRYAHVLPAGVRLVFDGRRGWLDLYGEHHPLHGASLREVERRAERWDFLSRYLGQGVELTYAGVFPSRRLGEPDRHVVKVDDRRFGGEPFWAYFDQDSGLLAWEEYRDEHGAYLRVHHTDYGPVGSARVWGSLQYRHLRAPGGVSTRPVSYAPIDEDLFRIPERRDVGAHEGEPAVSASLRLEVLVTKSRPPTTRPVLPGGSVRLESRQRRGMTERIEALAVGRLRRLGTFAEVLGSDDRQVGVTDYLLRVTLFSADLLEKQTCLPRRTQPLYSATLYAGSDRQPIMQDGPPDAGYAVVPMPDLIPFTICPGEYLALRPGCEEYEVRAYAVDEEVAYADHDQLSSLVARTATKAAIAASAYQGGQRSDFAYMTDFGFCGEP